MAKQLSLPERIVIENMLGTALFRRLFTVIITDNGVEFKNPKALEHTTNGLVRSHVFFCDPQASWQKPQVENNHRLVCHLAIMKRYEVYTSHAWYV